MSLATLAAEQTINAPSVSYHALMPIFIVLGAGMVGVLIEAFAPRETRFGGQVTLTLAALTASFVGLILLHGTAQTTTVAGALSIDRAGLFLQGTIVILALMATLLVAERNVDNSPIVASAAVTVGSSTDRELSRSDRVQTEIFPLLLFAVSGMMLFTISNNLLLMFVALEVFSLPLYLMAGMARRRRLLSQEAALKYFLLGAFGSAFFLYGIALLYGYANSVDLRGILEAASNPNRSDVLLYAGLALLLVGLLFKAGIAPFHNWTPDVYEGSPTPVTAFMAACTKTAAFAAILRVLYVGFSTTADTWRPVIWAVAIASMVVGAVFGLTQVEIKRILAYSSIAHAGFILVALVAVTQASVAGVMFYLVTYGFATIAAFGLVTLVRDANGEATHLSQWSGMARKSPLLAITMTVLLMSMAGIPLTAGFTGKFYIFAAAFHTAPALVIIALLASAVAAFFYLRIVVMMFFADPPENGPTVSVPGWSTSVALTVCVLVTIVLGVFPQPLIDLAHKAATLVG